MGGRFLNFFGVEEGCGWASNYGTLYHNVVLYCIKSIIAWMNEASKQLGQNLKRIRTEKDISQGDIARELDVSRGYISTIENGKTNPTLSTIARIAKALGVTNDELLK